MRQAEKALFKNKYGYFTEDGSEYVVTDPHTPRPWAHVVANEDYGFVISQTGGGFSWYGNSQLSRLNTWHQDLIRDDYGKYIYVRDNQSGSFWSTTWKPVCIAADRYEARYGFGYSQFTTVYNGVKTEQLMYVPRKGNCEIWELVVTNVGNDTKDLSFFSFMELCLGNGTDTHREFQKTFIETQIDVDNNVIYGKKRQALVPGFISTGAKDAPLSAFLCLVNHTADGFDGDKESFVGMYRSLQSPQAVVSGALNPKRTLEKWGDAAFSSKASLVLQPGESKKLVYVFGRIEEYKEAATYCKKYASETARAEALQEVKAYWASIMDASWIETPDKAMDFLTNKWYRYQALCGRMWAKTGYYQCSGGIGFRDQLQDSNCMLESDPKITRDQILLHAEQQFPDGTVYHWWHPGTGMGAHTGMSDDLLWMVLLALNYTDETGDYALFSEKAPFVQVDRKKKPEVGTLYTHCCRAIDKVLSRWSKRGLPLIGEGDWNDGMSHVGVQWKGESVWLGHFLYGILLRFKDVCVMRKDGKRAAEYVRRAQKLKDAINKHTWDGEWYIRATRDNGIPLGSKSQNRGKIFLNAQTWAVINGTATPERARIAMDSAYTHLYREYGPLLFTPGYDQIDGTIGYLSRYAPSVRENGGVYTHAACWGVQAAAVMGDGDMAYKAYRAMCPVYRGENPDLYYAEPYVTAGNVDGPDSENFGRGGWTWYSGSGSWMQKVAYNWITGIHATSQGLEIDPCIPKDWKGFKAKRLYRGSTYLITVKNPKHINKGVREIVVNGERIEGKVIFPGKKKGTYEVVVTMG